MYHVATTAENAYNFSVTCGDSVDGFSGVVGRWDPSWYPPAEVLSSNCHQTAHIEAANLKIDLQDALNFNNATLSRLLTGIDHNFGFVDFSIALFSVHACLVLISNAHDIFMRCASFLAFFSFKK